MENKNQSVEVELCYAWVETDCGVFHAFEVVDADTDCDFDAVADRLAESLDTTADDEQFNWDSMRVRIPDSVVSRIKDSGK